jgi:acyl-CoA thioesterase
LVPGPEIYPPGGALTMPQEHAIPVFTATLQEKPMQPAEIARACADRMWEVDQTRRALDLTLVDAGPGRAVVSMRVREDMLNSHRMCHGGFLFTLADSAFAYACNTYDATTVAQNCSITFLIAGREGDLLTATCEEVARAGRSGIYDATVVREDGAIVAEFRGLSRTVEGRILG